jgi:GntR family transcriptional regulator
MRRSTGSTAGGTTKPPTRRRNARPAGSRGASVTLRDPLGSADQPLYEQAHAALAEMVEAGAYRPGSRLPSERMLGEALGVSRLTLRRALESLVAAGVLQRRSSRGWFVASGPVTGATNELLSFARMALARGLVPSSRVLEQVVRPATLEEADILRVAPGAPVHDIERLRMLDGIPISVERSRIPVARAPWLADLDLRTASLYASLEERGLIPTSADYTIGVLDADERLAALLDVPAGKGLLLATGVTRDQLGKAFELAWAAYRADRYRIQATLARGPSGRTTT